MDSYRFQDLRMEKAMAMAKYRRAERITTLFRFVEAFVFLVVLSRFSTHFAFSFHLSTEYFQEISVALISPRSVFLVGNAIVLLLFLISGRFSGRKGEASADLYDEYVEKCRINNQQTWCREEIGAEEEEKVLSRTHSVNLQRAERRIRQLKRSMSEQCCRKVVDGCGRKAYGEEEMSGEEFRRTVEAFIARQQRFLREEEEFSAVVSFDRS